ncbi:hypothetical protein Q3G72_017598 [Acer saccharum]|nr:hypothetical protein Q3G72_017598 [Acer saccharum]
MGEGGAIVQKMIQYAQDFGYPLSPSPLQVPQMPIPQRGSRGRGRVPQMPGGFGGRVCKEWLSWEEIHCGNCERFFYCKVALSGPCIFVYEQDNMRSIFSCIVDADHLREVFDHMGLDLVKNQDSLRLESETALVTDPKPCRYVMLYAEVAVFGAWIRGGSSTNGSDTIPYQPDGENGGCNAAWSDIRDDVGF